MRTFWLSFADDSGHLGVCVVDIKAEEAAASRGMIDVMFPQHLEGAEWITAASSKAYAMGCNPGGEILSIEVSPTRSRSMPRNRLLSKQEVLQFSAPLSPKN